MKYKVGDKVRVRKDLEVGKDYGKRAVVPEMTNLAGMISTIKSVGRDYYELEEDIDLFDWTDEMIEGLWEENKPKYKLIDILNKIANGELKEGTKVIWDVYEYTYKKGDCYDEYLERKVDKFNYVDIIDDMALRHLNTEVELIEPNDFPDVGKMAEHIRENTKMIEPECISDNGKTLEPTDNTKTCEHEWAEYAGYNSKTRESKHYRECVKCGVEEAIEDNTTEKIEELDLIDIDFTKVDFTSDVIMIRSYIKEITRRLIIHTDKLNEVINKVNAQTTVVLSQEKDIEEIKNLLDY